MIRHLRPLILACGLAVLSITAVLANDAGRESQFSFGMGARSIGMGGAFTSLADEGSSVYYNPAALARLEWQELSAMHASLFEGTIWDIGTWVYPIGDRHGVGVSFMRLGTGDIERRVDYNPSGTFGYSTWQFTVAYGSVISHGLSIGLGLKIVSQELDQYSDYAVGGDIGLKWRIYRSLSAGIIARDLVSPRFKLNVNSERTPTSIAGGLSLNRAHISKSIALSLATDLSKNEDRDLLVQTGGELLFGDRYAVRGGYDREQVTLGAGVRQGRLSIDYAWKQMPDALDDAHIFSLSMRVGKSVSEQIRITDSIRNAPPQLTEEEKRVMALREKANRFFHNFELDSALVYFNQLFALSPGDEELIGTIAAIENAIGVQREQEAKLRTAEQERQQYLSSYYDQAKVFYDKKYYRAALDVLNLIFDVDPENVRAHALKDEIEESIAGQISHFFEVAHLAEQDGLFTAAIDAYNSILELEPTNGIATAGKRKALSNLDLAKQLNQAIQLYNDGKFDEAEVRFQAVLEVNPNESVARDYLKRIATSQKHTATLDDLQADRTVWGLYLDGMRFYRDKEYDKAIEVWQKVLESYPGQPNTLENIELARRRLKSQ